MTWLLIEQAPHFDAARRRATPQPAGASTLSRSIAAVLQRSGLRVRGDAGRDADGFGGQALRAPPAVTVVPPTSPMPKAPPPA